MEMQYDKPVTLCHENVTLYHPRRGFSSQIMATLHFDAQCPEISGLTVTLESADLVKLTIPAGVTLCADCEPLNVR